jgi:hypothetical protein
MEDHKKTVGINEIKVRNILKLRESRLFSRARETKKYVAKAE